MFRVNFCNGCLVQINCSENKTYKIVISVNDKVVFEKLTSDKITKFGESDTNYFIDYKVDIYLYEVLVFSEKINLKGKRVKINIESKSLGDNIAWISQIDKFQKLHDCNLYVSCSHKDLFESVYPNLIFTDAKTDDKKGNTIIPGLESISCKNFLCFYEPCNCYYASYDIGFYVGQSNITTVTLCKVASDMLGIEYEEIVPKIHIEDNKRKHKNPYVCIGVQSTAQYKYWNNPNGWNDIVKYLKSIGYDVICIDKEEEFGQDGYVNKCPDGVINKTGNLPLQERITDILHCDFFIGLGSGLSWLSWSLKKPVIMISGFSNPISEFKNPYRVFNSNVCNSCWNDVTITGHCSSGWSFCPRNKNFECSSEITPEMVIEKIDKCIKDFNI
jgi:autotransporter strand-loop-strand O-heptosyltransferase